MCLAQRTDCLLGAQFFPLCNVFSWEPDSSLFFLASASCLAKLWKNLLWILGFVIFFWFVNLWTDKFPVWWPVKKVCLIENGELLWGFGGWWQFTLMSLINVQSVITGQCDKFSKKNKRTGRKSSSASVEVSFFQKISKFTFHTHVAFSWMGQFCCEVWFERQ